MRRWITVSSVVLLSSLVAAGQAAAQETPGPGKLEVTFIPAGATFFTNESSAPNFNNFNVGAAAGYNFSRVIGVEGEASGSFGLTQHLPGLDDVDTPNMLSYNGNVVVGLPGHSWIPYATGGVGGMTVYSSRDLGFDDNIGTFLTGNVGGGLKWYQSGGRWGLRGDYRFQYVKSKDDAPAFFGQDARFGNRIYGGVILNVVK
jgi:outer membrane protein with beta-barrel domain